MKVQRGVSITARDGTRLACDVYLPDAPGRYPALLSYSHYGKDLQRVTGKRSPLNPLIGNGGQEAGDSEYFVSRGYAHVIADARGSGDSAGEYCYQGPKEQEDGYDIIEWMASQPWCDGNCGMFGMSYFAVIQYMVAAQQPPHLKAIVPYEALTDRYRQSVYHGGILNEGFWHQWWGHVSVDGMRPLSYDHLSQDEIERRVARLMESPEVRHSPYLHIQLKYPRKNPLLFDWLLEPLDGPFYWERSPYRMFDRIKIPTFLATRWTSWAVHLAGAFEAYKRIDAPKKLLLMETESRLGPLRPWADHQDLILRWYDHWLKGNDTGFMDEPPIRLLIKGKNEYRDEQEWPLARTQWTKMYLGPNGTLSLSQAESEGSGSFKNDPDLPPNQHAPGITFTSAPFDVPTEMTGPLALYVHARLDQPDATWIVTVRDVAPDGTSRTVTKGWLRASQRELDVEKSRPYQPYQKHTRRETLEPGQSYEFAIEIRETSNVFLSGHRIALDIKGQDTTAEDPIWVHTCNALPTTHAVQFGGKFDSYLLLPVIPG
jgi:putative CocE/NonD family hydrolase